MLKSLGLYLGLFLLLSCVITAILFHRFPPQPPDSSGLVADGSKLELSAVAGAASGLFLTLAIGSVTGILLKIKERKLLAASAKGAAPVDGKKTAACGALVADGPLLTAPLSGKPCVTYRYRITLTTGGRRSDTVTACWGYGLTPCHVKTPGGEVRILAYTDFAFEPVILSGPEMISRARAYFATTKFVPTGLGSIQSAYHELKDVLADNDGSIKADFGSPPAELNQPRFSIEEHAVADREEVCAFGRFSAPRGGLVPDPKSMYIFPVSLRRGSAVQVGNALLTGMIGHLAGALVMAAVAAAVVWGFYRIAWSFI